MDDIISSGPPTLRSCLVMGVLSSMAVAVRTYTKHHTQAGVAWDDYWIWFALAAYWAYTGVMFWSIFEGGGGLDMINFKMLNMVGITLYLKSLVINTCLFVTSVTAIKLSILCFYHRLFSVNRVFMRITIVLSIISVCWWITNILGVTLYCVPLRSFWDPLVQGRCINFGILFLVTAIVDLLVDVTLLALPLWIIPTLQLSGRIKWTLGGIFVLGGFVCITAIVRIIFVYVPGNPQINFARGIVWSNIHVGTAMVCACLPTYRPLLIKGGASWSRIRQRYSSKLSSSRRWFKQSASTDSPLNTYPSGTSGSAGDQDRHGPHFHLTDVEKPEDASMRDLMKQSEECHQTSWASKSAHSTV